jgi:hypothetical protein
MAELSWKWVLFKPAIQAPKGRGSALSRILNDFEVLVDKGLIKQDCERVRT